MCCSLGAEADFYENKNQLEKKLMLCAAAKLALSGLPGFTKDVIYFADVTFE